MKSVKIVVCRLKEALKLVVPLLDTIET